MFEELLQNKVPHFKELILDLKFEIKKYLSEGEHSVINANITLVKAKRTLLQIQVLKYVIFNVFKY